MGHVCQPVEIDEKRDSGQYAQVFHRIILSEWDFQTPFQSKSSVIEINQYQIWFYFRVFYQGHSTVCYLTLVLTLLGRCCSVFKCVPEKVAWTGAAVAISVFEKNAVNWVTFAMNQGCLRYLWRTSNQSLFKNVHSLQICKQRKCVPFSH